MRESKVVTKSLGEHGPRGRVGIHELAAGETYFSVYSATGVCFFRTRSEDEAREMVAKDPAKRSFMRHVR